MEPQVLFSSETCPRIEFKRPDKLNNPYHRTKMKAANRSLLLYNSFFGGAKNKFSKTTRNFIHEKSERISRAIPRKRQMLDSGGGEEERTGKAI